MTTYNDVNNAFTKAYHTHLTFQYADTSYVTKAARDLIEYQTNGQNVSCLFLERKRPAGLRCAQEWIKTHN